MILRISAEITGGKSKHGRKNLLGLEADKLSARGVIKHWNSYTQPILDSLSTLGLKPIGVCMDSHEAGSQNWTQDFAEEFKARRGYDLRKWLPAMVGYVIGSAKKTDRVLADVRLTIADLICDRYGDWHILCLGFRQIDIWQPFHHLGREVFLMPVQFGKDGWFTAGLDGTADIVKGYFAGFQY